MRHPLEPNSHLMDSEIWRFREESLRELPRDISDIKFELKDDGIAYITLDRYGIVYLKDPSH